MIALSKLIVQFEASLVAEYGDQMLPSHHKALSALKACRNHYSARMHTGCERCDHQQLMPHSCGHRHCPHCQHHESQRWIERQLKAQVPGQVFLLTFTLPKELRPLAWDHQRTVYGLMMQCVWQTLRAFTLNDKQLQGTPGCIAVLHTHRRDLGFHPHVHVLIPAGAIHQKSGLWRCKRAKKDKEGRQKPYLFNHKALAKVFRAKLLAGITGEGLRLPQHCPKTWVVHCKAVGDGAKAMIYLGRYLYRGVIAEKDILACDNGQVTYRYKDAKSGRMKRRTVTAERFLWLVLQHVLPRRFRRARNYGFWHPNAKGLIIRLQLIFRLDPKKALALLTPRPPWICPCCGGPMRVLRTRLSPRFELATASPP